MFDQKFAVIHEGDTHGNNMIVKVKLSSGREIYGFGTPNIYGGDWDVGPTWNYVITGMSPFLLDAGRRGQGLQLIEMIHSVGIGPSDLKFVVLSHGHEDHDGGLFDIVDSFGMQVKAHRAYDYLNRTSPSNAPSPGTIDYPASCWRCPMPESFSNKHCRDYHKERQTVTIAGIGDGEESFEEGISIFHAPGHSPDAVVVLVDDEAVLVGDTVLFDITPHPTREQFFDSVRHVLPDDYAHAEQLYGLRAYLHTLGKLKRKTENLAETLAFPGHRLFHAGKWNHTGLCGRIDALVDHHIQRCSDILDILKAGPETPTEIAEKHFDPRLLKGFGIYLAINEVLSHCELLALAGDVAIAEDGRVFGANSGQFEALIRSLYGREVNWART